MDLFSRLRRQVRRPWLRMVLGLTMAGGLLALAVGKVDLDGVAAALGRAKLGYVILAQITVFVGLGLRSVRWQRLLQAGETQVGHGLLIPSLLVGQMLNTLLPTRLGELSRVQVVGKRGPGRAFVLGTVVVEKFFDMAAYILLLLVLVVLAPLPAWARPGVTGFVITAGALFVVLAVAGFNRGRLLALLEDHSLPVMPKKWQAALARRVQAGMVSMTVLGRWQTVAGLLGWSLLIWGIGVLTNQLLFMALDMDLPVAASILLLVVLQVSVALPSTPGTIGIFESLCVFTLAVYGVDRTLGLSYGLLLHAVAFLLNTLLGLFFMWRLGLSVGGKHEVRDD